MMMMNNSKFPLIFILFFSPLLFRENFFSMKASVNVRKNSLTFRSTIIFLREIIYPGANWWVSYRSVSYQSGGKFLGNSIAVVWCVIILRRFLIEFHFQAILIFHRSIRLFLSNLKFHLSYAPIIRHRLCFRLCWKKGHISSTVQENLQHLDDAKFLRNEAMEFQEW